MWRQFCTGLGMSLPSVCLTAMLLLTLQPKPSLRNRRHAFFGNGMDARAMSQLCPLWSLLPFPLAPWYCVCFGPAQASMISRAGSLTILSIFTVTCQGWYGACVAQVCLRPHNHFAILRPQDIPLCSVGVVDHPCQCAMVQCDEAATAYFLYDG